MRVDYGTTNLVCRLIPLLQRVNKLKFVVRRDEPLTTDYDQRYANLSILYEASLAFWRCRRNFPGNFLSLPAVQDVLSARV